MSSYRKLSPLVAVLFLGACATIPNGPSMLALPGSGKTFDQFRYDDAVCRQYASEQIGGADANKAATDAGVKTAVVGTLVGAAIGAAADGSSGAGAGAAAGLMMGSVAGAGAAQDSGYALQRRYDHAYVQCMYAKGNQVPVRGQVRSASSYAPASTYSPPPVYAPPPPPSYSPQSPAAPSGYYPPPPPPPVR